MPRSRTTTEEDIRAATIGEVRALNEQIRLLEYDPAWPVLFELEAAKIRSALGERVLQLDHVGSTSVPGLSAKPILDLLLAVENSAEEGAYVPEMEAAGYVLHNREPKWYEHRMFKGTGPAVNLHVFSTDCPEIERMVRFRDWLRSSEADRELYLCTKRELAQRTWKFTQNYADAKTEVVEEILERAGKSL